MRIEQDKQWPRVRLKNLCSESAVYGANIPAESYIGSGIRFIRTTDITEKGELRENGVYVPNHLVEDYLLQDGDILVSRSGTVGRTFLYESVKHGPCSYAGYLVKFKANKHAKPKFVHYCAQSSIFQSMVREAAISSTIENVNATKYANFPIPLPPLTEQACIARFLDHADEQIQRYIASKERLIALLEEERQALVHEAITRGLDPNVRLKDSGVEWLGEIPEHWEVRRVKTLSKVKRGASPRPIDDPKYFDLTGEYAWVRIADVTASNHYLEETTQKLSELGQSLSVRLEPGSLFLSIAGSVGKPIITRIKCCIHDGFVYFPDLKDNEEYLYQILSTPSPFFGLGKYGTQLNLNTDTVGGIQVAWPPLWERNHITEFLHDASRKFDEGVAGIRNQIDLMNEYRTRLIADVVTGQLDVREAADQMPAAT